MLAKLSLSSLSIFKGNITVRNLGEPTLAQLSIEPVPLRRELFLSPKQADKRCHNVPLVDGPLPRANTVGEDGLTLLCIRGMPWRVFFIHKFIADAGQGILAGAGKKQSLTLF